MKNPSSRKSVSGSALIVMLSTGISRVLGFLRNAVVSNFFGGEGQVDVLNAVFIIPNNLRKLVAEGALSSAFIPVLSHCTGDSRDSTERSRSLVASLLGFQLLLLIPFLILSISFARPLMDLILDFHGPTFQDLAGTLFAWMINYILLVSISSIIMAVLNVHGNFAIPALAPLMFSICVILCLFLFEGSLGIMAQVAGVLAGGVLQLAIQIPAFLSRGYSLRPSFRFRSNPDFRKVLGLWGPVVLTSGIFTINEFIATYFASGLGNGAQTAMVNALVFWQLPIGIFAASINTILFPRMSRHTAAGRHPELRTTFLQGMNLILLLMIPSAFALGIFGIPLVSIAFQHGAFTWESTCLTSGMLWIYAWSMVPSSLVNYFQRLFYARHENRGPLLSAIVMLISDVGCTILFLSLGMGVGALAWAHVVSSVSGMVLLGIMARNRLGGLQISRGLKSLVHALIPAIPCVIAGYFLSPLLMPIWESGNKILGLGIFLGLGVGFLGIHAISHLVVKSDLRAFVLGRFGKEESLS